MDEYTFHPAAAMHLEEIWDHIAEDSPSAADRTTSAILEAIEAVARFPNSGHRRPDLTSSPLRFTNYREYLIAYAPEERPVWVLAVIHGSPDVISRILHERY